MRLAGFNARAINTEPLNGQGIYPALKTVAASWDVLDRSPIAATFSFSWDERTPVLQSAALLWNDREFISESFPILWDETGAVVTLFSARWNIPFAQHPATSLNGNMASSRLTRHVTASQIGA